MGDVTKCAICGKGAVHVDNGTRLSLGGCCGGSRCCSAGLCSGWTTEPLHAAPAPTPDPRDAEAATPESRGLSVGALAVEALGRLREAPEVDAVRMLAYDVVVIVERRTHMEACDAEIERLRERVAALSPCELAEVEARVGDEWRDKNGLSSEPVLPVCATHGIDGCPPIFGRAALDALRAGDKARIAALEAALVSFEALVNGAALAGVEAGSVWHPIAHVLGKRIRARLDEIGQTSALSAALAAERARVLDAVKAKVEELPRSPVDHAPAMVVLSQVLAAIDAAREGV